MYPPVLVTPPNAGDPVVTLTEAKTHLRVDGNSEDALITSLVAAAVQYLDGWTGVLGRCLATQTWRQDFDSFSGRCMRLPLSATTIASVKWRASDGTLSTVSSSDYALKADSLGSYVRFSDAFALPADLAQSQAVLIEFTAGYGAAAAVPAPLKAAILLLVGHWYQHREAAAPAGIAELPMAVDALIAPYRRIGV